MTTKVRKALDQVEIEIPIRKNTKDFGSEYIFRGSELIDTLELAIIKSPELRKELKNLFIEIIS